MLPISVIAENIRSLYNVGAIFRTADGVGVEKLILCGYTGTPPRKEIDKTALGSTESVPWEHAESAVDAAKKLKAQGYHIAVLEAHQDGCDYREAQYTFPLCLVVGNEVSGIGNELLDIADSIVSLPMRGIKESLNVAVAFGIAIYDCAARYEACAQVSVSEIDETGR